MAKFIYMIHSNVGSFGKKFEPRNAAAIYANDASPIQSAVLITFLEHEVKTNATIHAIRRCDANERGSQDIFTNAKHLVASVCASQGLTRSSRSSSTEGKGSVSLRELERIIFLDRSLNRLHDRILPDALGALAIESHSISNSR